MIVWPRRARLPGAAALALLSAGCASLAASPAPEFSQRAAPRPGQDEIELLAGLEGRLAIEDGCLGVSAFRGDRADFVTIVWPWNAALESAPGGGWQVRQTQSGAIIPVGAAIRGGGGFGGTFDDAWLRDYNRHLTRKLSARCAAKGTFALNRDFRPG